MTEKSKYIEIIKRVIKENIQSNIITFDDKHRIFGLIDIEMRDEFDEYNRDFAKLLYDELFHSIYQYDVNKELPNIDIHETEEHIMEPTFEVPTDKKKYLDRMNELLRRPQPIQKSKEWFELRQNMITASMIATILNQDPYKFPSSALEEKCRGADYTDNIYTYHGKKYEAIASMLYSIIYNVELLEFGILSDSEYNFIGASPDAICSIFDLDKKYSPRIARMVEIKCPPSRKFEVSGELIKYKNKKKGIVPIYYWIQMQIQLQVCNLDECDFLQCEIDEYENREQYLRDAVSTNTDFYEEQGVKIDVKNTIKKGAIIELLPKDQIALPHIFNAKYIYPKTVDMSTEQYEEWLLDKIYNLEKSEPEISKNYYFSRIVYFKIKKFHNILVKRDTKWFQDNIGTLKSFFDNIMYYRQNPDKLNDKLEEMRKTEPKVNSSGYLPIPNMYKNLQKKMDLSCNPYAIQNKKEEVKNDKKPDTKKSVFIPSKKTNKYEPKDDFLSSTD
jgi:putative phage-type endonuclease